MNESVFEKKKGLRISAMLIIATTELTSLSMTRKYGQASDKCGQWRRTSPLSTAGNPKGGVPDRFRLDSVTENDFSVEVIRHPGHKTQNRKVGEQSPVNAETLVRRSSIPASR